MTAGDARDPAGAPEAQEVAGATVPGEPGEGRPRLLVLPTGAVAGASAGEIIRVLTTAVESRGVAHWATTGGSAAPGIYGALRVPPLRNAVDWSRVHTWWGDDRFVPPDDPMSNVRLLEEILLGDGGLEIPRDRLHPVPVTEALARGEGPAWAAARYAEALAAQVPEKPAGTPVLDLVIVGVGPDGHILSVFPGSDAWDDPAACVAIPAPTHIGPHVERITMHPRLVGAAREVLVIAAGGSKAGALGRAWKGDDVRELPVRAARLATATWILDEAAAAELANAELEPPLPGAGGCRGGPVAVAGGPVAPAASAGRAPVDRGGGPADRRRRGSTVGWRVDPSAGRPGDPAAGRWLSRRAGDRTPGVQPSGGGIRSVRRAAPSSAP